MNEAITIENKDSIKICGNVLTLDKEQRYKDNVGVRIKALENNLRLWSKQNITLIGRSLILKTFAMSQLVFVSQFMNIAKADIWYIKRVCLRFMWGSNTERLKRGYSKNSTANGGIDAVDVHCFLQSIKSSNMFQITSALYILTQCVLRT